MKLLKRLAGSKKFAALVLGVIGGACSQLGLAPELAEPVSQLIVVLVSCYMLGQGVADHGKEAALVHAATVVGVPPMMRNPVTGAILSPDDPTPDPEKP